jgi:hypothetical protein
VSGGCGPGGRSGARAQQHRASSRGRPAAAPAARRRVPGRHARTTPAGAARAARAGPNHPANRPPSPACPRARAPAPVPRPPLLPRAPARLRFYEEPQFRRRLVLHYGDLSDSTGLVRIVQLVQPDEIYNLGAQSHVAVSFEMPEYTADVDGVGALRLLDAIRICGLEKKTKFYQASTSELYGKVQEVPQKITTPFYPRSPYAVAKLYAYWITVNYREAYGIFACNGVLFNHGAGGAGAGAAAAWAQGARMAARRGMQRHAGRPAPARTGCMGPMRRADSALDAALPTGRSSMQSRRCVARPLLPARSPAAWRASRWVRAPAGPGLLYWGPVAPARALPRLPAGAQWGASRADERAGLPARAPHPVRNSHLAACLRAARACTDRPPAVPVPGQPGRQARLGPRARLCGDAVAHAAAGRAEGLRHRDRCVAGLAALQARRAGGAPAQPSGAAGCLGPSLMLPRRVPRQLVCRLLPSRQLPCRTCSAPAPQRPRRRAWSSLTRRAAPPARPPAARPRRQPVLRHGVCGAGMRAAGHGH